MTLRKEDTPLLRSRTEATAFPNCLPSMESERATSFTKSWATGRPESSVEVMKEPFEKTATQKIRRFKYKESAPTVEEERRNK